MLNAKFLTILFGVYFLILAISGPASNLMAAEIPAAKISSNYEMMYFLTGLLFFAGGTYGFGRHVIIGIGVTYLFVATLGYVDINGAALADPDHANLVDHLIEVITAASLLTVGLLSSPVGH